MNENNTPRPLHQIAREIDAKWHEPFYGARPYIRAMRHLDKITDMYDRDDAEDIVLRFLDNAKGWRGEDARRIKAELRALLP